MSYSDMLHEFMENDLPTNREETLFHALARDEDLRFEMKYLLSLRSAVQSDEEAGVVPLATTQSLFSRLGYTAVIPAAETAAGAAGSSTAGAAAGSGVGSIVRNWGSHLLAGLVGMLLAGSFFMMGEPTVAEGDRQIADRIETSSETTARLDGSASGRTTLDNGRHPAAGSLGAGTVVSSLAGREGTDRNFKSGGSATGSVNRYPSSRSSSLTTEALKKVDVARTAMQATERNNTDGIASESPEENARSKNTTVVETETVHDINLTPDQSVMVIDPVSPDELMNETSARSVAQPPVQLPEHEYETYGHYSFTARGSMVPLHLTESRFGLDMSRGDGLEKNFALGLSYSLSPEFSAGIEAGVDSYLMYFREERSGGAVNEHEAFSSPFWIGLTGSWRPISAGPVPLFVQGFLGGSHSGAMGRMMVGGEFNLEKSVTLIGGAELSAVGYQYDNNILLTPRFGLTAGVRFNNLFETK